LSTLLWQNLGVSADRPDKNTLHAEEMCAPAFHFAAIMLKYKLEKVDVKMKRTESEESSMDFSALEKEASRYENQLRAHRRALHQIPEVGYEEHESMRI